MKKINNYIKNNILIILEIFVLAQPFLDVITSIGINYYHLSFTIGMIVRFIFLIFSLYYLFFIEKPNKKILIYLTLFIIYSLLFFLPYFSNPLLFKELQTFLKTFYFILILLFFINIKDRIKKIDYRYFCITFIIYLLFIIVPNLIGNFGSYDIAKIGEKGLFNSANEIGAIISFLFPIYLYQMFNDKKKLKYIPGILLYFASIFVIGTKVPVVACALTLLFFLAGYFTKIIETKETKKIIVSAISIIVILVSSIVIIPKTPFYKNIKTHMNYFEINSFKEVFTSYDNINNIVYSERLTLTEKNINKYNESNLYHKIVGIGRYEIKDNNILERKTAEIDYVDIFVSYGIIGFILFFAPIIYLLTLFIINYKKQEKQKIMLITLHFLIFTIALFSGHVFVSPAVSLFVALFLII